MDGGSDADRRSHGSPEDVCECECVPLWSGRQGGFHGVEGVHLLNGGTMREPPLSWSCSPDRQKDKKTSRSFAAQQPFIITTGRTETRRRPLSAARSSLCVRGLHTSKRWPIAVCCSPDTSEGGAAS